MKLKIGFSVSTLTLILNTVSLDGVLSLYIQTPYSIRDSRGRPKSVLVGTRFVDDESRSKSTQKLRYQHQRINETCLNMNNQRKDNERDERKMKKDNGELQSKNGGGDKDDAIDLFFIEDPRLLLGDMLFLLLTCLLLGFTDVLNTPSFWENGGFAQPVDLSPKGVSTLGTVVERDSVMSIAWVSSSIKHRGYTFAAVSDELTTIKCCFTILTDYSSLLIILALTTAFLTHSPVDPVEILRKSYYTILMLSAFRIAYGRSNKWFL